MRCLCNAGHSETHQQALRPLALPQRWRQPLTRIAVIALPVSRPKQLGTPRVWTPALHVHVTNCFHFQFCAAKSCARWLSRTGPGPAGRPPGSLSPPPPFSDLHSMASLVHGNQQCMFPLTGAAFQASVVPCGRLDWSSCIFTSLCCTPTARTWQSFLMSAASLETTPWPEECAIKGLESYAKRDTAQLQSWAAKHHRFSRLAR